MPIGLAVGTAAVGVGTAYMSSKSNKKAAKKAAETSKENTAENNAFMREMYGRNEGHLAPYEANGFRAGNALMDMLLPPAASPAGAKSAGWQPGTPGGSGQPQINPGYRAGTPALGGTPAPGGVLPDDAAFYGNDLAARPGRYNLDNGLGGLAQILRQRAMANGQPQPTAGAATPALPASGAAPATPALSAANTAVPGGYQPPAGFDNFIKGTNYQWRLNEGMDALNGPLAAKGMFQSGAADKARMAFNQNFASQELGNYMSLLSAQQGLGFSASSAIAGIGQNYAGQVVNSNNMNAANQGNAALMQGNANSQMWGGIGSAIGQGAGALFGASSYRPPMTTPPINSAMPSGAGTGYFAGMW